MKDTLSLFSLINKNLKNVQKKHKNLITFLKGVVKLQQKKMFNFEEYKKIEKKIDFFGKKTSLTVSGQLEAETYALGLGNVYTFGPTFRAENSNTSRHASEFWMIEPEMAFYDLDDNMDLAESFLKYILQYILDNCSDDLIFLDERLQKE